MKGALTFAILLSAGWIGLHPGPALGDPARHEISQHDKAFHPNSLQITAGETVVLHNNDKRTHNIRVFHPDLDFNSGEQPPGEDVEIAFETPGTYYVTCGIHTQMELKVTVTAAD